MVGRAEDLGSQERTTGDQNALAQARDLDPGFGECRAAQPPPASFGDGDALRADALRRHFVRGDVERVIRPLLGIETFNARPPR